MAVAARSFGALLADRRGAMAGRERELSALLGVLADDGPLVAVVHGIAGSGKSTVLRAFAARAAEAGAARVVWVDGREVEPTPEGLRAAVGPLDADADGGRVVVVVDTAERLRLIDAWLRQEWMPSLPAHARVVIGTRDAPGAVWRASFGSLARVVALESLPPQDALAVLRGLGLDEEAAATVNGVVHGHPLSLHLAASAVGEGDGDALVPAMVSELAELYLEGLDARVRRLLEATSILRRITMSLLEAVVPGEDAADAFAALGALPFVELGREGLVVHDTIRETVCALVRAQDPLRLATLKASAWRQIRREIDATRGAARWASLADMITLVDEPLIREAFFPSRVQHYAVEPARADDEADVFAITARHEPPEHVEILRAWWRELRGAFRVARGPRGDVVAYTILCDLADVPRPLLERDPLCAPWRAHLRAAPIARGERVLIGRMAIAFPTGTAPSSCLAALLRDMERASLQAGPTLRRIYTDTPDDRLLAQVSGLGFIPLDTAPVLIGDREYQPLVLDLGPESVSGWLSTLAAADLPLTARGPSLDPASRSLLLGDRSVSLSSLEFELLSYLSSLNGRPASREALLHDVWGHAWTGGSNVVDAAVAALRRKLGPQDAGLLETVRGVGYRWRTAVGFSRTIGVKGREGRELPASAAGL